MKKIWSLKSVKYVKLLQNERYCSFVKRKSYLTNCGISWKESEQSVPQ